MTLSPFRQPLTSALNIDGQERFDLAFLRRLLQAIDVRLKPLQEQQASVEQTLVGLQGITLDRINDILTPAIEDVFTLTERGFLIAASSTEASLAVGNILEFEVSDDVERRLFTPSPFTALTRSSTADDYAVARSIAYDSVSGIYRCQVEAVVGAAGPHSDWVIGALAGSTVAQYALLSEGQSVRDVILAAVTTVLGYRDAALGAANAAGLARDGAEEARDAASGSAGDASDAAEEAEGFAQAAAVFDPGNYASVDHNHTLIDITDAGSAAAASTGDFATRAEGVLAAAAIPKTVVTTRGDLLYRGASAAARLAKGTSGQVLTQGADDPAWADVASVDVYDTMASDLVAGGLGSHVYARSTGGDVAFGGTVAGSLLRPTSALYAISGSGFPTTSPTFLTGAALTGEWTCLGYFDSLDTKASGQGGSTNMTIRGATLWQRTL